MQQLPYSRADRVGEEIQKIVASFFCGECSDERVYGINITGVKMTRDLNLAYIYYYIAGSEEQKQACGVALTKLQREIKQEISENLSLKFVPQLKFFFDESIARGERIDRLLSKIKEKAR